MIRRLALVLLFASLLSCKEDPAAPLLKSANDSYAKKDYAKAGADFEEALKLNPKQDVKVYEKAAFSYMSAGNYDKATELLLKTLDFKSDTKGKLDTYRNIAGMYLQTADNPKRAEEYFGKVLALDPKDDQSLTWLAEIAARRGGARDNEAEGVPADLDVALQRYDQLITLTPANPAPYINKRIVLVKYLTTLTKLKAVAEKDAEENKDDQVTHQDFLDEAKRHQAKAEELKALMDETTKKLVEVSKAAKK